MESRAACSSFVPIGPETHSACRVTNKYIWHQEIGIIFAEEGSSAPCHGGRERQGYPSQHSLLHLSSIGCNPPSECCHCSSPTIVPEYLTKESLLNR